MIRREEFSFSFFLLHTHGKNEKKERLGETLLKRCFGRKNAFFLQEKARSDVLRTLFEKNSS
jgi:hypothetical protein